MQSVPINTNVESRSDELYSKQHYVIKFVSDLRYNWNIVQSGVKHTNPNPNTPIESHKGMYFNI
jgi:hypothetical protein